ncbi:divergent PAP2 family protein [Baia soyae]|uniref:Divergent PAP2 family protein n=1 Tax=Baia soyae TaxID=1544746 RepID=A0A4R2RWB9_9BACL|nr:divergent PAP2 family protein [Baia soyae]TCP64261.1 hypothetical protein EDD57_14226 [Baia soyae]
MFAQLFDNFCLWTSVTAIFLAQFVKVLLNFSLHRKWNWRWFYLSGGMPSGHTSAVTSLAASIGITQGFHTTSFAIATIIGIIVMYDATGVRRQAGMQAQAINQLIDDFAALLHEIRTSKLNLEHRNRLKEILGHKPIEVFVGAWFGIFVALMMYVIWY